MALKKIKVLLSNYEDESRKQDPYQLTGIYREAIEEELIDGGSQEMRDSLEGEELKPHIGRMLKDESRRDLEEKRRGAKGVRG